MPVPPTTIVTLTMNPSIDVAYGVDRIVPTHKIRTTSEYANPGGGGINVARVFVRLGGNVRCIYLSGGPTGVALDGLLDLHQLVRTRVPIAGHTRIAMTMLEHATGQEYRITPAGPDVHAAEWRAALSVAPSAAGAQAFLGLGSAWVGGPQNLARYVGFGWSASGALLIWSKDGTGNTYSFAAAQIGGSAITSDTAQHLFRIDWSNNADVGFYYDGNRVNAVGSVVWAATGANAVLQPWSTVYKPSGTGLATLTVDKIDVFNGR